MLTFNLKKERFDKIKSGEKTHEYREVKQFWTVRFLNAFSDEDSPDIFYPEIADGKTIVFACGYPKADEKDKILKARIKSISIVNGKSTDLKINKPVYDIEFKLIKEK